MMEKADVDAKAYYFLAKIMGKSAVETNTTEEKIEVFEGELSKIVGLSSVKEQLQSWAKQGLLNEWRRSMGLVVGPTKLPHMAFLGNPGTGKTMVANMLGELLHTLGMIPSNKVVEVQPTDFVKMKEAKGGVLAYRLTASTKDCEIEAGLEEIMSLMDDGETLVILAGYTKQMQKLISANEGIRKRVAKFLYFDDFTCRDLADIARLKMSALHGFKLHPSCTAESIERVIKLESTDKQRKKINGGLVDTMLVNARENLDKRSNIGCMDIDSLVTITLDDLAAGLRRLSEADGELGSRVKSFFCGFLARWYKEYEKKMNYFC